MVEVVTAWLGDFCEGLAPNWGLGMDRPAGGEGCMLLLLDTVVGGFEYIEEGLWFDEEFFGDTYEDDGDPDKDNDGETLLDVGVVV